MAKVGTISKKKKRQGRIYSRLYNNQTNKASKILSSVKKGCEARDNKQSIRQGKINIGVNR